MFWFYYSLFFLTVVAGLVLTLVTLPGNWLMLLAAALYGWATGWNYVGVWTLGIAFALAGVGELVELMSAGRAASKLGGTKWGTAGALLGGLLGGIFLTAFIPVPVIGTLIGILIGTFVGAACGELIAGQEVGRSLVIGTGATKGRLIGTVLKVAFGLIIAGMLLVIALPIW